MVESARAVDVRGKRPSISVSGKTYDRLRERVSGSLDALVDDLIARALEDPAVLRDLVRRCRVKKAVLS